MADEPIINAFEAEANTDAAPEVVESDAPAPVSSDDDILSKALEGLPDDDDGDTREVVEDKADHEPEAKPDAAGDTTEAERRGLEALMTQRGFTAAQAKRMLDKDPDFVREVGQSVLEAEKLADADAGEPEAKGDAPAEEAKPEDKADPTPEVVTAKIAEILGKSFDKDEAQTIAEAIGAATAGRGGSSLDPKSVAGVVEQAVSAAVAPYKQALAAMDGHVSMLLARQTAFRLSEAHPELKTEEGFKAVYAQAQRLATSGKFQSIDEVLEAAATIQFGSKRRAEINQYKDKVNRHRENGAPAAQGGRTPAAGSRSRDDVVLEMSLNGATEQEIEGELARMSRR